MHKFIIFIISILLLITLITGCRRINESKDETKDNYITIGEVTTIDIDVTTDVSQTTDVQDTTVAIETTHLETSNNTGSNSPSFDNSLFIGDSRTVGIRDYGDLGNAYVFASVGMNIVRLFEEEIDVTNYGNATLDTVLSSKSFDKIYIMLGINEIGYNHDYIIKKYGEVVETIREKQPNAIIYVMANLHIVKSRSDSDNIYNNKGLNELNEGMRKLCNGKNIKYLDVNELFADSNGYLIDEYASDDFHLEAEYYQQWSEWIFNHS